MKEKIIFIGHSYHKKTKSDQFMIDYLSEFYDVEIHYDESWNNNFSAPDYSSIATENCKTVVFWVIFPKKKILKKLAGKNIIFFPMYEECLELNFKDWYKCKNVTIINFSLALHKKLTKFGLKSCYLQYFPKPSDQIYYGNEDEVFFWQRPRLFVNINSIFKVLKNGNYKIHIHEEIDIAKKLIANFEEKYNYQITYSKWFDDKDDLNKIIQDKAIYIAPRINEGIGMSFLEAMAMGKLVIAHNAPTMNEYIENGKTGFLFDNENPKPIDVSNVKEIQKNTYEYIGKGHKEWCRNRKIIIDIIKEKEKLTLNQTNLIWNLIFNFSINSKHLTTKMKLKKITRKIKSIIFPSYKLSRKINDKLAVLEEKISQIQNNSSYEIDLDYLKNNNSFFIKKFKIKDPTFANIKDKKLFFLHIPKTGGRTFSQGFLFLFAYFDKNMESRWISRERLVKENKKTCLIAKEFRIFHGHVPFGCHLNMEIKDEDISYFTLVRNPVKHCFSMYNYMYENFHLPKSIDFDSFIKMTNNIQTKLIAGFTPADENHYNMIENFINDQEIDEKVYNRAIKNIEQHFFLVAPTERMEDVMKVFITVMDLPDIITHSVNEGKIKLLDKMTEEQIKEIEKSNYWDAKLHNYVSEKFAKIYDRFVDLNKENLNQIYFLSEEEEYGENSDIIIASNAKKNGAIVPTKIKSGDITLYSKYVTKR